MKWTIATTFFLLLAFYIGVLLYKAQNPFSYPGLEGRILVVLIIVGVTLLSMYLYQTKMPKPTKSKKTKSKRHKNWFSQLIDFLADE